PDRIRQCYWFDPRSRDALAVLDQCFAEWRFCMVKVHQCWTPFEADDQVIESLAAWCGHEGLPLFAHPYRRRDVARFLELCKRHRRTRFILGHLIGAENAEHDAIRLDNLYLDTSPPQLVGDERIVAAVRRFGSGRIIMGSDTPYGRENLRRAIDRIDGLPLTSSDKDLILGSNLAAMLRPELGVSSTLRPGG
ncbi:MAG: amidohydrolase family protein, partial [Anaerolineae bacterium]|nr:amidohydrolase family protein [Anaerolineae bacterium]